MIFDTNIPETTGHQMAIQFPTSPSVCQTCMTILTAIFDIYWVNSHFNIDPGGSGCTDWHIVAPPLEAY